MSSTLETTVSAIYRSTRQIPMFSSHGRKTPPGIEHRNGRFLQIAALVACSPFCYFSVFHKISARKYVSSSFFDPPWNVALRIIQYLEKCSSIVIWQRRTRVCRIVTRLQCNWPSKSILLVSTANLLEITPREVILWSSVAVLHQKLKQEGIQVEILQVYNKEKLLPSVGRWAD